MRPEVDAIVAACRSGQGARAAEQERIQRLAGMLAAAGHRRVSHAAARVLKALADAGVAAGPSVAARVARGGKAAAKRFPESAAAIEAISAALG